MAQVVVQDVGADAKRFRRFRSADERRHRRDAVGQVIGQGQRGITEGLDPAARSASSDRDRTCQRFTPNRNGLMSGSPLQGVRADVCRRDEKVKFPRAAPVRLCQADDLCGPRNDHAGSGLQQFSLPAIAPQHADRAQAVRLGGVNVVKRSPTMIVVARVVALDAQGFRPAGPSCRRGRRRAGRRTPAADTRANPDKSTTRSAKSRRFEVATHSGRPASGQRGQHLGDAGELRAVVQIATSE